MLFCHEPCLEKWSPDFSTSALTNPTGTRVRCGHTELCNSLEWTEWSTNPVQVQICDACGTVGCASGGYAHISAMNDLVLWTRPRDVNIPEITAAGFFPATAIEKFGSVAVPVTIWDSFRSAVIEVPELGSLTRTDGYALCSAWVMGQNRPNSVDQVAPWLRARLLAADSLDTSAAIEWVEYWLRWFGERDAFVINGSIATTASTGAKIEKLYFDGPGADDWPALAKHRDSFVPAFGPNHIFIPGN